MFVKNWKTHRFSLDFPNKTKSIDRYFGSCASVEGRATTGCLQDFMTALVGLISIRVIKGTGIGGSSIFDPNLDMT